MVGDGLNCPRQQGNDVKVNNSMDRYSMRISRTLNLKMANLTTVPEEIFELAREEYVSFVNLKGNFLTEVPPGLKQLTDFLNELVLANNQIGFLPSFISHFSLLTTVDLSCNLLRTLPAELGALQLLNDLNISYNRFEVIPSCIYELQNLEVLTISNNQIRTIDADSTGLGSLQRLKVLDLSNNNLEFVPPVLGLLTNIVQLKLVGNPFRLPRHDVLNKGTAAVMEYLRGRIPQ